MSFYRCNNLIVFNNEILGNPLERVNEIKDLGIVFDRTLSFVHGILDAWLYDENMC